MSMGCFPSTIRDGYYDNEGCWQRTKFCFVDCRERCTCKPPGNLYYDASKDERLKPADPDESEPAQS